MSIKEANWFQKLLNRYKDDPSFIIESIAIEAGEFIWQQMIDNNIPVSKREKTFREIKKRL